MKNLILFVLLMTVALVCNAQSKSDTTKKQAPEPKFKPNPNKLYTVTLKLTLDAGNIIAVDPDKWKDQVRYSPQLHGNEIGQIEQIHAAIRGSIIHQLDSLLKIDEKHWADSVKSESAKQQKLRP